MQFVYRARGVGEGDRAVNRELCVLGLALWTVLAMYA